MTSVTSVPAFGTCPPGPSVSLPPPPPPAASACGDRPHLSTLLAAATDATTAADEKHNLASLDGNLLAEMVLESNELLRGVCRGTRVAKERPLHALQRAPT